LERAQGLPSRMPLRWRVEMARLVVILVVALIIFGPQDLPRIARSLWRALEELRRVSAELGDALHSDLETLEQEDVLHPPTI
jgi:Sec-independent protein translocase protein TatA